MTIIIILEYYNVKRARQKNPICMSTAYFMRMLIAGNIHYLSLYLKTFATVDIISIIIIIIISIVIGCVHIIIVTVELMWRRPATVRKGK